MDPSGQIANGTDLICPYSDPPLDEFTDDHIFPNFLGGRRSVRICRDCNSRFGHSFEAKAAIQLKRLQVFVSHFGLDLTRTAGIWPSALEVDGITYNLKSGPDGVQYELARPVIRRDERGKITGVQARSRPEAEQSAADLIRKGKAEEVNITESQGKTFHDIKLTVDLSYNPDLYRLAAKLVGNMAISIGLETFVRDSGLGSYLHGSREWKVSTGFCDTSSLRRLRPGLSHTIYLELGTPSRAVVIFFGGMQIFLPLPPASKDAFLGFLDPLSGEESFARVNALNINQPPEVVTESQARFWLAEINRYFSEEANARGAKHPPNLSVSGIDLGKPGASYVFVPVWRSKAKLWFTI